MANGALSGEGVEGEIRKKIIENDLVWGIVACPPKLFYNVPLAVTLWFLRKTKPAHMKKKVLFIYAKKMFRQISRKQVVFTDQHIDKIVEKFKMFEKEESETEINELGFAKIATLENIKKNGYVLTSGRYVGIKIVEDGIAFEEKMKDYSKELSELLNKEKELNKNIREVFKALNFKV